MTRVLVTGDQGYIGSVLVPILVERGHGVVGLDTGFFDPCTFGPLPAGAPERRLLDLRDVTAADLDGIDAVVHLAAISNDPMGDLDPQLTHDINHHATIRLAKAAKAAGARRFVYASSCSVYGAAAGAGLVDETAPMQPVSAYAVSKVAAEQDLHALADDSFSPVYLRNATAHGLSPRLRVDLVLNNLVAWAHLTGEVRVLSDGTPWRPLVHVRDIAAAVVATLEAPLDRIHDEAFNVGTERENLRVRDIAEVVADVVPGSRVVITGESGGDPRSYRVDFSKIRAHLPAFEVMWSAARSAQELYEWYVREALDAAAAEQRYTRLRWLQGLTAAGRLDASLRWVPAD